MPFRTPSSSFFLDNFPGWNRIEARSRLDDFTFGLQVSVADPLWLLGRQWQLSEFQGEDAGTPIHVQLTYETVEMDYVKLGNEASTSIGDVPIEVLVEREAVGWDWRMRVRAGQQFERLAREHFGSNQSGAKDLIEDVRIKYPVIKPTGDEWLAMDSASQRFVSLMEKRAIDGELLLKQINSDKPDTLIPSELRKAMVSWYQSLYSQGPADKLAAWKAEHLDYEFRVHASGANGSLRAASYRNGEIEWSTFDVEGTDAGAFVEKQTVQLTPTPVRLPGMPARRWWEFEDSAVNFGALDVAKTDVAKLAMIEVALVSGDDWFVVPLAAKPNTLIRIREIEIHDCFGQKIPLPPARIATGDKLARWNMFALSNENGVDSADFLYVPPLVGTREESPVLEAVHFARDEGFNAVFAIEQTVSNHIGEPISGHAVPQEHRQQKMAAASGSKENSNSEAAPKAESDTTTPPAIRYVMATQVPANWFPFVPVDVGNIVNGKPQRSLKLRRAVMASTEPIALPLSRLLDPAGSARVDWIYEESVGRAGARVELRRQRMRSTTGETFVWLGRKVFVGKGEARSGSRFDSLRETTNPSD